MVHLVDLVGLINVGVGLHCLPAVVRHPINAFGG